VQILGPLARDRLRAVEERGLMLASTKDRARGQWRYILPKLGIDEKFLLGRNCPCPICGGTDRFRYLDRRGQDADGMWLCNRCTPHPRPAIELLMKFAGMPFKEAARAVDAILGDGADAEPRPRPKPPDDAGKVVYASAFAKRVWARGVRVQRGDVVDRYLRSRGVGMDLYPPCIRTSALDWYRDDKTRTISRHPAMLALIHDADGKPVATHRTYLAPDGQGKAAIAKPRKIAGQHGRNPTIRLAPPSPIMGVAEGIETALSAMKLFGVPTWSAISTYGIETFEPPAELKRLIIFADHDRNGAGQRAVATLVERLSDRINVDVMMPSEPDTDWNDVLRSEQTS
jgi:putative DNA primase/helicase